MTVRSLCIHAHFYQPPREDPLTGSIPVEHGAAPYHDWNQRIHAECYRPNAELGNFKHISFNVGPTLCQWMDSFDPDTCRLIVAQDRANVENFGVGNAIAQGYNHSILPLATHADKVTQVAWGVAAFESNFGRKPQGMWLPETAVDLETLGVLADQGIQFTILAPWQADGENVDPTEPYRVALPGGKSIAVFFYHRDLSTRVSFDPQATTNADIFARDQVSRYFDAEKLHQGEPQILVIATDGELYGHHQQFRDHFLAHLVNGASSELGITTTYPALWLKQHPPQRSIGIRENTSWSCHHGVMRWMGECSCTPGFGTWKAYLRRALDRLAESLDRVFIDMLTPLVADPWDLRNQYIHVILGQITVDELIAQAGGKRLLLNELECVRLLLEAQHDRQRMFTSCGWYFDDFCRIEPRNNIAYAVQAVWLTRQATGVDLSPGVIKDLEHVISHHTGLRGDMVFQRRFHRTEERR